jgi:hypothetical protein
MTESPAAARPPVTAEPLPPSSTTLPTTSAAVAARATFRLAPVAQWGVVVLAAVAGLMLLWWPLGHDQGILAINGAAVARGGLPYRAAFENRGPLSFFLFALISLAFGPNAWGVRLVDLGVAVATAVLLYRMLASLGSRGAARLAGAAWILTVVSLGHQDSAQVELWIGSAMLACVALVAREPRYRASDLALFGALVGTATTHKPFFPLFLAVPGAVVLLRRWRDVRGVARDTSILVAGAIAPLVLMLAWFWAEGGLHDLWEAHVLYTLQVYVGKAKTLPERVSSLLSFFVRGGHILPPVPTAVIAAAVGVAVLWRGRRALVLALGVWFACAVFTVFLQGRFFLYHWTLMLPALAPLAAAGCVSATRAAAPGRWLGVAVSVALVAQCAIIPLDHLRAWLPFVAGGVSADTYYADFTIWQTNPAAERSVARYLRERTRPGEPIGMWAVDGAVPFLADRPSATRFASRRYVIWGKGREIRQRYRREYLRDIAERRPPYFVINLSGSESDEPLAREFPELGALVAERYVPDTIIGNLEVLRLRSRPADGSGAPPPLKPGIGARR